jgi:transposase-like protein
MTADLPVVEVPDVFPVEEDFEVAIEAAAEIGFQFRVQPGDQCSHGFAGGIVAPMGVGSDSHAGLRAALEARFPGVPWQRGQFHFQQNAMAYVPRISMRSAVAEDIRNIFNAAGRVNLELRRRTRVAGLFPNDAS